MKYIYLIRMGDTDYHKIGITSCIERRLTTLQTGNPFLLKVVFQFLVDKDVTAFKLEGILHNHFVHLRIRNEWFKPSDVDLFTKEVITILSNNYYTPKTSPIVTDLVISTYSEEDMKRPKSSGLIKLPRKYSKRRKF